MVYSCGPQPSCDRSTLDNFTAAPGVLSQQCFHGMDRPFTCPESEWCHHQYTFWNFAAPIPVDLRPGCWGLLFCSIASGQSEEILYQNETDVDNVVELYKQE